MGPTELGRERAGMGEWSPGNRKFVYLLKIYGGAPLIPVTTGGGRAGSNKSNQQAVSERKMGRKPDMVVVLITLFVFSVLASGVAQSALF